MDNDFGTLGRGLSVFGSRGRDQYLADRTGNCRRSRLVVIRAMILGMCVLVVGGAAMALIGSWAENRSLCIGLIVVGSCGIAGVLLDAVGVLPVRTIVFFVFVLAFGVLSREALAHTEIEERVCFGALGVASLSLALVALLGGRGGGDGTGSGRSARPTMPP